MGKLNGIFRGFLSHFKAYQRFGAVRGSSVLDRLPAVFQRVSEAYQGISVGSPVILKTFTGSSGKKKHFNEF